jgi:nicotinate-nucleotide--dimethylbenzimidazole phosphoribosyltransferase
MMTELSQIISQIEPLDPAWEERAQERLDSLTKPRGSLGRLEELAARYVAITREPMPPLDQKWVVVFAADHGVVAEEVSAYPQEVTHQMVLNFLRGGAGINVLSRHVGARVAVVDIGVNHDFSQMPDLIIRKVAYGSRNMAKEPAMTREEAIRAMLIGVEMAELATASGMDALAAGDMGIGNTTPAAALASVFTGRPVAGVPPPPPPPAVPVSKIRLYVIRWR